VLGEATETFKPLIAVMIFGGLRVGEALALKWREIDFEHGFIRVRHQLGRDRQPAELKTDRGRRDVILIPDLAKALREHRMRSLHKQAGDFLFPAPEGPRPAIDGAGGRADVEAGRARQARLSSHTFRHTFASLLIVGLKLDPGSVAAQLGHSNPATAFLRSLVRAGEARRRGTRRARRRLRPPFGIDKLTFLLT
jgi:integrase